MPLFRRHAEREDPADPDLGPDLEDSPARLAQLLDEAITVVNRAGGELPPIASVQARHLIDTLGRIVARAQNRPLDVHTAILVRRTATDYLPTTIAGYLAVPTPARQLPTASGVVPARSLTDQLSALQAAAEATLAAARDLDVDALLTQGRFLATKFTRSDLDLT